MKRKDNLKGINIKQFLIPYSLLVVLYSIVSIWVVNSLIQTDIKNFETEALGIAKSYSKALATSEEARIILNELLDSRLAVAGESIALYEGEYNKKALESLAHRYRIDVVYIYNNKGEIINTNGNYMGWKAYEGHPVYAFMNSGKKSMVEEIRQDSESGILYKYAYYKMADGSFVQIGVLADKVKEYLGQFDTQSLIESIKVDEFVKFVSFIDNNNKIVNSTNKELIGMECKYPESTKNIATGSDLLTTEVIEGEEVNIVYVPVVYENNMIGTLSIAQSIDSIKAGIGNYIISAIINLFIMSFLFGIGTFMVYRKSKKNYMLAYYDRLTGLPNRDYLQEYIEKRIKNENSINKAIFLLNCTNFKTLNQIYGYEYGNKILKEISDKIVNITEGDELSFFRFESDKFVIYLENYKGIHELEQYAKQVSDIFVKPFTDIGSHQYVDVEIGIVEIQQGNESIDDILKKAAISVDNVKGNSSCNYSFYDDKMENKLQRKEMIEKALRNAMEQEGCDSIYLEYQPQLNLKTNRICGFEALVRLKSERLGIVSPIEFIQVAEKKLLIAPLGYLIMQKAASFINCIESAGFKDIQVAVNVSGLQILRDDFIDKTIGIINKNSIQNSCLEIEITESVFLDNFEPVNEKLKALRCENIVISLDDFGTGYSSLSMIKDLNIDTVKIDRSFINNLAHKQHDNLITADIISMAHKLGLKVVAEGVENEMQKKYLIDNNCDIVQGYLFSKPLSHDMAVEFLKKVNS